MRQHEGVLAFHEELFPPRIAFLALGDADKGHFLGQVERGDHLAHGVELSGAAVDEHHIGPVRHAGVFHLVGFGIAFAGEPGKAAGQHFAHHAEVVARRDIGLDVEGAIVLFRKALLASHHHRAHRIGARNVRVVIDFNAAGRFIETKAIGNTFQQGAVGGAFGKLATQSLSGIVEGVIDQISLFAPAR